MGKTIVDVKFTNAIDLAVAKRGYIPQSEIRSLQTHGIVDTGAVLVSLPETLVNELGLEIVAKRRVRYADGKTADKSIAGGLLVEIQGRTSETRCIVEPESDTVLIGQIPLEEMDWMVHPQSQKLVSAHEDFEQGLIEMY